MGKSQSHRRAQQRAAGSRGRTEVPLKSGRVLDARRGKTATEIERSGSARSLRQAARRLKQSPAPRKVLQVPQPHMGKGVDAMRKEHTKGSVKNMSGTKRRSV